jgi:hypothetical protein
MFLLLIDPIFVVFVGRLIHEIKNPTNNEIWEAV